MKRTLCSLGFIIGGALLSVSAQAACGGGGFKTARVEVRQQDSSSQENRNSKLEELQRDVDKALSKLENCEGDCDKERRKLAEARAKLAKKVSEY